MEGFADFQQNLFGSAYYETEVAVLASIEEDKELLARIIKSQRKIPYGLTIETIKDNIIYCRSIWGGHLEYRRTDKIIEYKDVKSEEVIQVPEYELITNK
jgi:hypothetical protein